MCNDIKQSVIQIPVNTALGLKHGICLNYRLVNIITNYN
jgi:hypothetical protein